MISSSRRLGFSAFFSSGEAIFNVSVTNDTASSTESMVTITFFQMENNKTSKFKVDAQKYCCRMGGAYTIYMGGA